MKYFTPELMRRLASESDEVADRAQDEWETACRDYHAYLQTIKDEFPEPFLRFQESYALHDACILSQQTLDQFFVMHLVLNDGTQLGIAFEQEGDPNPFVIMPTCEFYWLYDEVEKVGENGGRVFQESILFTDTTDARYEVRVRFVDFHMHTVDGPDEFAIVIRGLTNRAQQHDPLLAGAGAQRP
ncbi:MAG: hypothetical protein U0793_27140 [Gemmataceae bacterium]